MAVVLVVDDESDVRKLALTVLKSAGHTCVEASDGLAAIQCFFEQRPDLVLLDLGLPKLDGFTLLRRIREVSDIPVIVLTARAAETEKVRVLNGGANDYITKPFSTRELLARVQVALRNLPVGETASDFCDGPLRVDRQAREVRVLENIVRVTSLEFRLLLTLIGHRGRILATGQLLEHVWDDPIGVGHDRVKFCVMRLRNKISVSDLDFAPIETVRGFGYRYRNATIS